ncbi:hypothetical protein ACWD4L_26705 [Streptomyces sp. NPDC002596]|uniref:hypothetical protein n=1 Tax=unclassified Streptomyces TaxID=2593676 RepID=UPI00225278F6|nr:MULTISPECIES: hypothetical protein [unclassified Streptomyces]MCX4534490.1 hypothetical protein [Streptomyces sp. NBC_01669]WSA00159.1 hypothetical protein OHA79_21295 [Streptomyces sp. NBC_00841]
MTDNHPAPGSAARPDAAGLDPVRRLHALAAGVRGARVTTREIAAPYDTIAPLLADLDGELARLVPDMRGLRLTRADGDRIEAVAVGRLGLRARFDGIRRPGWVWLQSRFLLIGMAATPSATAPDHTLVAFTGGVRVPGHAALLPVAVGRAGRRVLGRLEERVAG